MRVPSRRAARNSLDRGDIDGQRIDYCEPCSGYLKTYDGQGNEAVLLSDWISLHLDLVAHDRGLKRLAVSLYELSSLRRQ